MKNRFDLLVFLGIFVAVAVIGLAFLDVPQISGEASRQTAKSSKSTLKSTGTTREYPQLISGDEGRNFMRVDCELSCHCTDERYETTSKVVGTWSATACNDCNAARYKCDQQILAAWDESYAKCKEDCKAQGRTGTLTHAFKPKNGCRNVGPC